MSGDYSRRSFEPGRDYSAVLMQQGRVQLDADWNAQSDIRDRRCRAETADLIGPCGVPPTTPDGFRISVDADGHLEIGRGRIYVDGLLAENHGGEPVRFDALLAESTGTTGIRYDAQPRFPTAATDAPLPDAAGVHLVYLDVWRREVTHLQDPTLVETAIGVDTTTREQTVWQVKILNSVAEEVGCGLSDDQLQGWAELQAPSAGRLTTGVVGVAEAEDPCLIPPTGGFRGLENRLYRVEIHGRTADGGATKFKFSRDNAAVAATVNEILTGRTQVRVSLIGRDQVLRFRSGDWVELTDDVLEFRGQPGEMARIVDVDDAEQILHLDRALPDGVFDAANPDRHTRVVRWDQREDVDGDGLLDLKLDEPIDLNDGVVITFSLDPDVPAGEFKPGDCWLFAARTVDGTVEDLHQAPPRGIHHHYCRLALVERDAGGGTTLHDSRPLFPPLTGLTRLEYVGGDGQEADPNAMLPQPLRVAVFNGSQPVPGVRVRFTILDGAGGELNENGTSVDVATADDGIASCTWKLSTAPAPGLPPRSQQVAATLLDLECEPLDPPIIFNGNLSLRGFFYVGGDGQEALPPGPELPDGTTTPAGTLPRPLQVAVVNDYEPVGGAQVKFEIQGGIGGLLNGLPSPQTVTTGPDGVATCDWKLDANAETRFQQVEATLLDATPAAIHHPIRFNATLANACLRYVGGDGQEAAPGAELCGPLMVRYADGLQPFVGEKLVEFRMTRGQGTLIDETDPSNQGDVIVVDTDDDGLASCRWRLANEVVDPCAQVVARAVGPRFFKGSMPVVFNARVTTGAVEGGLQIQKVLLVSTKQPLRNDQTILLDQLKQGIQVTLNGPLAPHAAKRAAWFVTVEDPLTANRIYDFNRIVVAYVPFVLAADIQLNRQGDAILWRPTQEAMGLLDRWKNLDSGEPLLARLTAKGNFVFGEDGRYLDGEAFGVPAGDGATDPFGAPATDLRLPTGDGRRGGDFEMWFWLRERFVSVKPPDRLNFPPVRVGVVIPQNIVLTNSGTEAYRAEVRVNSNHFFLPVGQVSVDAGATTSFPVFCRPVTVGNLTGQLFITGTEPGSESFTIDLSGQAVP